MDTATRRTTAQAKSKAEADAAGPGGAPAKTVPGKAAASRSTAAKSAQAKPGGVKPQVTRRLAPADRRREILTKAIEYFAKVGFDGGTRELARHLGTTQPLLYRYFPTKDALIEEIYKAVYLDLWQPAWDTLLADTSRPLRQRLQVFYEEYTAAILNPQWIRIYFFAGLKGVKINEQYLALVEDRILRRIIREFHRERGLKPPRKVQPDDLEIAWTLQGGIFYYGVRKYIYGIPTHAPAATVISNALDVFFAGYGAMLDRRETPRAPARKPAKARS